MVNLNHRLASNVSLPEGILRGSITLSIARRRKRRVEVAKITPPGPLAPRATAVSAVEKTSGWDVQARRTDGERISGWRISNV